jgi:2-iminobutanoate/2-iminopropanoate deaminase
MKPTRILLLLLLVLASAAASSAADAIERFHLNKEGEEGIGYCKAVRVGDTLYVSGCVGSGEMPDAIRAAYGSIAKTLAAHGIGFGQVVKENIFTTDIDALIANKDVRKTFYTDGYPAATWVQVSRLFRPTHVIEVEVIAHVPTARGGG